MVVTSSEATRREYAARMNRVIDHIQAHLNEPLDLELLAAVACFSPFHFHRLFRAMNGETPQAYIHRLRLERAAQLLVFDPFRAISDIALECGFSGSAPFARAFKTAWGVSASEWRKRRIRQPESKPREAPGALYLARSKQTAMTHPFQVHVRNIAPVTVAYLRHIGPYIGNTALFRRLFGELFAWAEPRGLFGPDALWLSVFEDNPHFTPAAKQRLEVALIVPAGTPPSGKIGVRKMEAGRCATVRVRVRIEDYAAQWDRLIGDWLPGSGYQPDHRPALEFYHNNPETDPEGKYDIEICLPVQLL